MKEFIIEYLEDNTIYETKLYAKDMIEAIEIQKNEGRNVVKVEEVLGDIYFKSFI